MNIILEKIKNLTKRQLYSVLDAVYTTEDLIKDGKYLINEALTYYELRQFITLMYNNIKDKNTKGVMKELLRIITKLEILGLPLPIIRKQKSRSPEIF